MRDRFSFAILFQTLLLSSNAHAIPDSTVRIGKGKYYTYIDQYAGPYYFPMSILTDTSFHTGHDTFMNAWFSKHLYAMNEPILSTQQNTEEVFRFTWLRTFHHPVIVRLVKTADKYLLYWKSSTGAGGYKPGVLYIDKFRELDQKTWNSFTVKYNAVNFKAMNTNEASFGTDGAMWIFEAGKGANYHMVYRHGPREELAYRECCLYLLSLTDMKIRRREIY